MPSMASVLSYLPTVLFWLMIFLLLISELVGKFAVTLRPRFRRFAVTVLLMLCAWYAAETAHGNELTVPDFTPWTHFMTVFAPPAPPQGG